MIKAIKKHKIIALIALVALAGGSYYFFNKLNPAQAQVSYVTAAAAKSTIITSVAGSGQISASNQVEIKGKVSGEIVKINVTAGQAVKAGQAVAQIDATDAYKTLRDASTNLESAQLSLEKLNQPIDKLSLTQAENALLQAETTKQNAQDDLVKSYDDAFNTIANAFLDLPGIITGLHDILFSYTFSVTQQNIDFYSDSVKNSDPAILTYKKDAVSSYNEARTEYDRAFSAYKAANRLSAETAIEALLNQTYETAKDMADSVKSLNNFIQFYEDNLSKRGIPLPAAANSQLSALNTYTGKTNSHLLNLLAIKQTIKNDKDTILSSDRSITEKTQSLAKLKAGTDPLDIKSQQLSIKQRENALADARQALADYTVRAPFDGIIAEVSLKPGDSASGAIATIVTKQQLAEITLNEVDLAKIKAGLKVNLSFDAIDGLTITGQVAEIDTIGAVSQGVVTYGVKILFDTQDQRVKPGMSVNATIIVDSKIDVLAVASSAVKNDGADYVEVLDESGRPLKRTVAIGLSDDTLTEIISGLNEGDQVVTQTITSGAANASASQTGAGGLRIPGVSGGASGGVRSGGAMFITR